MLLARTSFVDVCLSPPALPIIPDHNGLWKICLYEEFYRFQLLCYHLLLFPSGCIFMADTWRGTDWQLESQTVCMIHHSYGWCLKLTNGWDLPWGLLVGTLVWKRWSNGNVWNLKHGCSYCGNRVGHSHNNECHFYKGISCYTPRLWFKVLDYDKGWDPHDAGAAGTMPGLLIFVGAKNFIHVRQTLPLSYTTGLHAYFCVFIKCFPLRFKSLWQL